MSQDEAVNPIVGGAYVKMSQRLQQQEEIYGFDTDKPTSIGKTP